MSVPWNRDKKPNYLKAEREQAKRSGARAQVNSGRVWSGLRDVVERSKNGIVLLIDNKTGAKESLKSYRITDAEWNGLKRDANRTPPGCHPCLRLDIGKHKLMVIEQDTWDAAIS